MNLSELKKFCAKPDDVRYYLQEPWSREEYTYATNGHIIVRVPRRDDVPDYAGAPKTDAMFSAKARKWRPVPVCEMPQDIDCTACGRSGELDGIGECEWCAGTGKVPCEDGLQVGDANFSKRYLALIQGWQIAPNGLNAAWIRTDGADGLLMPRRVK